MHLFPNSPRLSAQVLTAIEAKNLKTISWNGLNADFRGRKCVNPRTDVSGTCSDECELNGQVPQPWDGHWVLVENRLAQHWVVTSPVEPDKDAVGPDVHRATGLDESPVELLGTHVLVTAKLGTQPAITTVGDHRHGRVQIDIQSHLTCQAIQMKEIDTAS